MSETPIPETAAAGQNCDNSILPSHVKAAVKALADVQGAAKTRTLGVGDVEDAVARAENFCSTHRVAKKERKGLVFMFDPHVAPAKAYKYEFVGTKLRLTATATAWKIEASRGRCGDSQTLRLLHCPPAAAIAAAQRLFGVTLNAA